MLMICDATVTATGSCDTQATGFARRGRHTSAIGIPNESVAPQLGQAKNWLWQLIVRQHSDP